MVGGPPQWEGTERGGRHSRASPSGAGEAAHKGSLLGPLRLRITVCLLLLPAVTHPPAGTMATGKQSRRCGSFQQLQAGAGGAGARHPRSPGPGFPGSGLLCPASHQATDPHWAQTPGPGPSAPRKASSPRCGRGRGPAGPPPASPVQQWQLWSLAQSHREALAVLFPASVHFRKARQTIWCPGESSGALSRVSDTTSLVSCKGAVPHWTPRPMGTSHREWACTSGVPVQGAAEVGRF